MALSDQTNKYDYANVFASADGQVMSIYGKEKLLATESSFHITRANVYIVIASVLTRGLTKINCLSRRWKNLTIERPQGEIRYATRILRDLLITPQY